MIRSSTLANGVRVVSRHLASPHSAALGLWLVNGTRHEAGNEGGFAHFLEHLLFKGGSGIDAMDLARRFEAMGGQINAHTGRELTCFHGMVPVEELEELLFLFQAILLEPAFDDHDVDIERAVILQEMAMVQDNPEEALEDAGVRRVWPWHPMGRPVLGSREAIEGATAADLHQYLQRQLTGGRVWVTAAGNIDHEALVEACAPLASLPAGGVPGQEPPTFTSGHYRRRGSWEQSQLLWALPAPPASDPQFYTLLSANYLLGGGTSSRLFQELREHRGLVYGVHSRLELYGDSGLWLIQTACDPPRRDECREATEAVVRAIAEEGVHPDELATARAHLRASLLMEEDDPEGAMDRLAREAMYLGQHPSLEDRMAGLAAVTPEAVSELLAQAWEQHMYMECLP